MYYDHKNPLKHLPFKDRESRERYEGNKVSKFIFGDAEYKLGVLRTIRNNLLDIQDAALRIWDIYPVHNSLIATIREYLVDEIRLVEARIEDYEKELK